MDRPTISIIVPIYNSGLYLAKCIKSILCQSFGDFELLLINDGSTDDSRKICDDFARTDRRIRLFNKENGGVSSARNIGLNNSKGEWITFIDSDDWVDRNYLMCLMQCAQHDQVDLVMSGYQGLARVDRFKFYHLFLSDTTCYTVPWGKLFKAKVILRNHIRFQEEMRLGEDLVFLYMFLLHSNIVYTVGDIGYNYNNNAEDSLSKRIFPIEDELCICKYAIPIIDSLLIEKQISNMLAVERLFSLKAFFIRRVLNSLYYNDIPRKQRIGILRSINISLYTGATKASTWKDRIYLWLLRRRLYICYDILRYFIRLIKSKRRNK